MAGLIRKDQLCGKEGAGRLGASLNPSWATQKCLQAGLLLAFLRSPPQVMWIFGVREDVWQYRGECRAHWISQLGNDSGALSCCTVAQCVAVCSNAQTAKNENAAVQSLRPCSPGGRSDTSPWPVLFPHWANNARQINASSELRFQLQLLRPLQVEDVHFKAQHQNETCVKHKSSIKN